MGRDERAARLAEVAVGLAHGAGAPLPDDLSLWSLAGARPSGVAPSASADPARSLVAAMESVLTDAERGQGAHYTPPDLAARVAGSAIQRVGTVTDPACGAGAVLLAAADRLEALGARRDEIARDLLHGADLDRLAVAVTEAAVALWSGGTAPAPGRLVVADALGPSPWASATFAAVVGNPPFQGQLSAQTARDGAARAALRARFGDAFSPYVDTAALFLLAALDLADDGARVALVQPQSTAAARDAAGVRAAIGSRARLVDLWAPAGMPFAARVHVCVPVLEMGNGGGAIDWAGRLATARGVPAVALPDGPTVATLATAVAGFRQHYYGLVGHVHGDGGGAPLVTSGSLAVGRSGWGETPVRFARRSWGRPTVDVAAMRGADPRLARWLDQVLRPKVVVASQTRVVEAAADREGSWVPCTPVVSVLPTDPADVDRLAAALCAPPVAAWAARRASGTGLSPAAIRMSAGLVLAAPLPVDQVAWQQATTALAAGDLEPYARHATAMYRLHPAAASEVLAWWWASQ